MPSNKNKLYIFLSVLLVIATVIILRTNLKHIEDSTLMDVIPWALTTDVVSENTVNQSFPALGKVVSSSEVRIVPQIGGVILKMGPREGAVIHKGDLLVHLDTRSLEADIGALKAKLASAEAVRKNNLKELQREQRLLKEGGSSASAVEQMQTRVHSDKANVRALKKQIESSQIKLSYGHIKAPIDGHIAQRFAELGDTVFPGKVLYTLTAEHGGRILVPVPLNTVTQIQVGGRIILSTGNQELTTTITRINPSLDNLAMGSLEIDLPERPFQLPNGAPIAAQVITTTATGLSVPKHALRPAGENATQRVLFKVITQPTPHIQQTSVNIQLCGKSRCVIKGDLLPDDVVVTAHGSVLLQLHDGDPILWDNAATVQP